MFTSILLAVVVFVVAGTVIEALKRYTIAELFQAASQTVQRLHNKSQADDDNATWFWYADTASTPDEWFSSDWNLL